VRADKEGAMCTLMWDTYGFGTELYLEDLFLGLGLGLGIGSSILSDIGECGMYTTGCL
jgi:hypothetical protein